MPHLSGEHALLRTTSVSEAQGDTLDGGPRGGLAGEGMKAADDVLEVSGPPAFGAANPTAAYLPAALLLQTWRA